MRYIIKSFIQFSSVAVNFHNATSYMNASIINKIRQSLRDVIIFIYYLLVLVV